MKLYHVTEKSSLPPIMKYGLRPSYDKTLRSRQLSSGTLVNLGGKKAIEEVLFHEPWDNPVLLEVNVSRKNLVKLEHVSKPGLIWYASRRPISFNQIKVIGNPSKLLGYDTWRNSMAEPTLGLELPEERVTDKEKKVGESKYGKEP